MAASGKNVELQCIRTILQLRPYRAPYIGPVALFEATPTGNDMCQLPADLEDAARIDGANELQVFTKVVLSLAWPGFLTVGLVVALAVWASSRWRSSLSMIPIASW